MKQEHTRDKKEENRLSCLDGLNLNGINNDDDSRKLSIDPELKGKEDYKEDLEETLLKYTD